MSPDSDKLEARIPEPELMEAGEQAAAYAAADFSQPDAAFVERFCRLFPELHTGRLLDLGCGPAGILLRLAELRPGLQLVGMEGSPAMLAPGLRAVEAAGLSARVRLELGRLPGWGPTAGFDALISNSLLHHLHQPAQLWSELKRLGRPGAPVLVADLRRPASRSAARALVRQYAGDEPEVLQTDYYNSLLAAFGVDEVRQQLEEAGLQQLELASISDRHLAVWGSL